MAGVTLERNGAIGVITLNRPETLNALDDQMLRELDDLLDEITDNDEILVIIITGAGKAFVSGADIAQMSQLIPIQAKKLSVLGNAVFTKLENMEKPTIAAVNGFALGGGCELCMACDIRLASENAKFGQPEVSLGITPGFGGTQRLPRIVGLSNAMELIMTARVISATRAKELGLVSHVYTPEELMEKAFALANVIAGNAQIAVRQAKAAMRRGIQSDITTGVAYEAEAFGLCFSTDDQRNAMNAFINKKKLSRTKNG